MRIVTTQKQVSQLCLALR